MSAAQEAQAVLREQGELLRRANHLERQVRSHRSQADVYDAELASTRERLVALEGKIEGLELGQRLAAEQRAAAENDKSTGSDAGGAQ